LAGRHALVSGNVSGSSEVWEHLHQRFTQISSNLVTCLDNYCCFIYHCKLSKTIMQAVLLLMVVASDTLSLQWCII